MPSSPTSSLRLEKQADGENTNLWGDKLDQALDKIDAAVAGWLTKALTGNYTLSTANYATDEASAAMLKFTGTGAFTVTVPAVSKAYRIWNACTGLLTITNGSSSTTAQPGEVVEVVTDGAANFARVQPMDFGGARITSVGAPVNASDAATKQYADDLAFAANAGVLPGQPGNAGKFLTTDGVTASWSLGTIVTAGAGLAEVASNTVTVAAAAAVDVQAATSTSKATTPAALAQSAAFGTLTDAAVIAWEITAAGYNATVTPTTSGHQVGAPTLSGGVLFDGCSLLLEIVQPAAGGMTVTWNSVWSFGWLGVPVLNANANKRTWISGTYRSATGLIHANKVWADV